MLRYLGRRECYVRSSSAFDFTGHAPNRGARPTLDHDVPASRVHRGRSLGTVVAHAGKDDRETALTFLDERVQEDGRRRSKM